MHVATEALKGTLEKGRCRECDKRTLFCRGDAPLNGGDAAVEFARRLLPWARAVVGVTG